MKRSQQSDTQMKDPYLGACDVLQTIHRAEGIYCRKLAFHRIGVLRISYFCDSLLLMIMLK